MRINKYISQCGFCSRRKADELIINGKVKVNGKVITMLGFEIRTKDIVEVDGKVLKKQDFEYYKFYKPAGYITTKSDEKGRKTIYDLIPKELHHLKPVGRLDKDSTGLLIMTNDGDFINRMTHPSIKIPKLYKVTVNGKVKMEHLEEFAKGIKIDGKFAWCDSEIIESKRNETTLEITLYQGLNRQIRKMFKHFGFDVIHLKRVKHAIISINGLPKNAIKPIKPKQLKELKMYLDKIYKEQKNA
ncbi:MAG: rRNA pseudouridine synthase [Cyanobacteria bacterium SIG30]|nr:rRNA pseudouridine synthase [Cyanobacteria bacterium SIG30]